MRDNKDSFFVDFGYMPQENEIPKNPTQASVSYSQLFDQALSFQQQKNWDSSLENYQKILDQSAQTLNVSQASVIYHNMSTIAFEKGEFLKAYIWSKKAVSLNPNNQMAAESLSVFAKKVEIPVIAHQISGFDSFKVLIGKLPLDAWLIFSLILVFITIFKAFKTVLVSKKNQLSNNFAAISKWPIYSILFVTLLVISITYIRYQDASTPRALVSAEKAQVQTAPGENKPVIFEAQAGLELEVLKYDQGYFQVRYSGAFSGWIKKTQLEILSLSFEQ